MIALHAWAVRNQVNMRALVELRALWGDSGQPHISGDPARKSESYVQSAVILEAGRKGLPVFRNNVGALKNPAGRLVRFGLGNDSKERNERIKSGDLIAIRPVLITQEMVGQVIGQFVSRECKPEGWTFGVDPDREGPQLAFAQLVLAYGGDARFVTGEGSL
jgi:hypothetical protein